MFRSYCWIALTVALYTPTAARANLVAYWDFNEGVGGTATDQVNANVGTLQNFTGGSEWVAGHSGAAGDFALDFQGDNDFVLVPDSSSVSVTGDITLSAWVNADALSSPARNLVAKDGNSAYRWRLQPVPWLLLNDGASGFQLFTSNPPAPSTSTWHHTSVSANFTTGDVEFYLDGQSLGTFANSETGIADTAGPLRLGTFTGSGEFFDGRMDEIGIFDQDLSDGMHGAIHSLAVEPDLQYDLGEVNQLIQAFINSDPSVTVDGLQWLLVNDGSLTGSVGQVETQLNSGFPVFSVNLGGGNGLQSVAVPEPSSWLLCGLVSIAAARRIRRRC